MEPSDELIRSIYRDKVDCARKATIEEEFRDGLELFDFGCGLMRDGIRMQHPDADARQVRRMMSERFAIARRLEDAE